jgi:hypothetical protein
LARPELARPDTPDSSKSSSLLNSSKHNTFLAQKYPRAVFVRLYYRKDFQKDGLYKIAHDKNPYGNKTWPVMKPDR